MSSHRKKVITLPAVVSVVGYSQSGKTRLLEQMIPLFRAKGYRVGVVKHTDKVFPPDLPGKDSETFRQAGADGVVLIGRDRLTFWMGRETADDSIASLMGSLFSPDYDLILTEGFKKGVYPKVLVLSEGKEKALLEEVEGEIIATVGFTSWRGGWPHFSPSEPEKLVEWLEGRCLKDLPFASVQVFLDGKAIPLNHFVQEVLRRGIQGMLAPLKGYKNSRVIEVKIKETDR